jgi:4-amino-4-deoxy-L-arabinose transferase-like glycosyltransferase
MKITFFDFLKSKSTPIILIILMIIAFILRTYYLNQNNIVFGYDQARDAYVAQQIMQGDLKILGPPVSFGNLYHGVIYYYTIAIPYYLSHGNPILSIYFLSFLNVLAIPLIYLSGKIFFNKKIGLLSAFIFTISFDIIQYSNWLSNPSLSVLFSSIFFLGIAYLFFTSQKNLGILLTAIGYAFSFQSEFFLGYLLIPLIFCLYFLKLKLNKKQIITFLIIALIFLSPMILSYVKFGSNSIQGLKTLFLNNDQFTKQEIDFSTDFKMFFVRLTENFNRTIFPSKSIFTFIFIVFTFSFFIKQYKKKTKTSQGLSILWIFLISQIFIIPFGGDWIPYLNAGFQIPVILISVSFIEYLFKNKHKISAIFLVIIFTISLIKTNLKYNSKTQILNDISQNMTIKNEINAIKYTYQDSQGKPFSINTITVPYWINTLWSYLYQWYGQQNYAYLPSFHGRDQTGQPSYLNQEINPSTTNFYLIIEPSKGIPQNLIEDTIAYEDSFSKIIETQSFNGILVQKRELTKALKEINFIK